MEENKVCPVCGASLPPEARHCTECGAKLEEAAAAAAEETVVQAAEDAAAKAEAAAEEANAVFAAPSFAQPSPSQLGVTVEEPAQEKPEPPYAQPAAPVYAGAAAAAAPETRPEYPPVRQPETADPDRPGKKSKYAPMTSVGMAVEILLMSIPVIGFILMILWSCGVCRKIARRNLARAYLILLILGIVLLVVGALLCRFVFKDDITRLVEQIIPGYTIQWQ